MESFGNCKLKLNKLKKSIFPISNIKLNFYFLIFAVQIFQL